MAVAMQNKEVAAHLGNLHEPMMRALYRCRQNVSDPEILKTLNIVLSRFQLAGISYQPHLLFMALKFAARARSLPAMKRHLKAIREAGLPMSSNLFRSVIAKFSIGHRGLGEIRNGRWRRRDLQQVIKGFEDAKDLPPEQQYHFGSFLDRTDWQYLHGWIAVLARCRDSDAVWEEYELWKQSDSCNNPKKLLLKHSNKTMTSKTRGDLWFIEQMLCCGDAARAWKIIAETDTEFHLLKPTVKDRLLDNIEYATVWTQEVRDEMIRKYDRDLHEIEQAFGVKWVRTGPDGEGQHELYMDQEEALDKLGDEKWKQNEEHGYPYDSDGLVPDEERALRDAVEGNAVK
ncbi:Hypothetical predicted protein [Lecanosticta acicola]|uniref:Uncharacterized protein n=1 Tax=Lecanosticta acicola TaxID=111012 RepID=A0AAI8Z1T9_9PEZI|nr:Hypothetical predicted protein [Lecanosticta acicola]